MWITRMTGYYNLGTTGYYNVSYKGQSKASMGVIRDIIRHPSHPTLTIM